MATSHAPIYIFYGQSLLHPAYRKIMADFAAAAANICATVACHAPENAMDDIAPVFRAHLGDAWQAHTMPPTATQLENAQAALSFDITPLTQLVAQNARSRVPLAVPLACLWDKSLNADMAVTPPACLMQGQGKLLYKPEHLVNALDEVTHQAVRTGHWLAARHNAGL